MRHALESSKFFGPFAWMLIVFAACVVVFLAYELNRTITVLAAQTQVTNTVLQNAGTNIPTTTVRHR